MNPRAMPASSKQKRATATVASAPSTAAQLRALRGRRRKIYGEASRLFLEKGYDATSMSDIAQAVNITKAGLYHFVSGKEELLFSLLSVAMDEIMEDVVTPALAVEDPRDRLKVIISNHLRSIGRTTRRRANPLTMLADEPAGLGPENRRLIDERKRAYHGLIRDTIEALRQRGDAPASLDPGVAAHCILGMILWMVRWRRPGGRLELDHIVDQIVTLALASVSGANAPTAVRCPGMTARPRAMAGAFD